MNSCLNGKVCIDKYGNIKNCYHEEKIFGNIKVNTLKEVIEKTDFCKKWNINKDCIDVCKDCPYRYMCVDCRYFIEDPANKFSKPSFCKYNPYEK